MSLLQACRIPTTLFAFKCKNLEPKMMRSILSLEPQAFKLDRRWLFLAPLGVGLLLRGVALFLEADVTADANLWEYGQQGLCAAQNGGDLCRFYSDGSGSYASAYMPPLLSYLWLILFSLFGDGAIARSVFLAVGLIASLGSIALTFYLTEKLIRSEPVAFLAAMIVACYPTFVFVATTYHQTCWAVFFILAVAAVSVKLSASANTLLYGCLGGALSGLSALNRSEMLLIGPVMLLVGVFWDRERKRCLKVCLAIFTVMGLIMAPWMVRNYAEFGRFIPTAQSDGYNLWKGYNQHTNGSGNLTELTGSAGWTARKEIRSRVAPGDDYEARIQEEFMEEFVNDIQHVSAGRLMQLQVTKTGLLWIFDWTDGAVAGKVTYLFPWVVTNIFAFIGLVVLWRNRRLVAPAPAAIYATAVALLTVAYVATSVHARYRMHIEPFIFMAAATGLVGVWARIRGRAFDSYVEGETS
ncbi:ArnT family glycosyltransferase [Mycolicibacterium diernhoferi]|nr:glycosyltransferase family 39 protein [Mycolicibacterium diernhoferi]OJZ65050.1 hypothetical protein BRW64_14480 [Mycolicibacterium diernhoferi]OPE55379.1 hypothetical protein BV510_05375 [Mycolicibacterium diernhoferi]QYL23740.1 glycosyltransferase family 39 protein [Mycolicibacterium diernhoferi]